MKVQVAAAAVTPVAPVRRLHDGLKMSISWRRASDYGLMDTFLEHDRLISGFSESFLSLSARVPASRTEKGPPRHETLERQLEASVGPRHTSGTLLLATIPA